jgi:hypothetical protein
VSMAPAEGPSLQTAERPETPDLSMEKLARTEVASRAMLSACISRPARCPRTGTYGGWLWNNRPVRVPSEALPRADGAGRIFLRLSFSRLATRRLQ